MKTLTVRSFYRILGDVLRNILILIFAFGFLLIVGTDPALSAGRSLDDFFLPPEHSARTVLVTCRMTVSDTSPEWGKVLLAGFIYASAALNGEEYIAVAIREQDGVTRVYTVRQKDFSDFINDRIQLRDFLRKVTISRAR